MAFERETSSAPSPEREHGVYTITQSEIDNIARIDTVKLNFLLSISNIKDSRELQQAGEQLLGIILAMKNIIINHFKGDYKVNNLTIDGYYKDLEEKIDKNTPLSRKQLRKYAGDSFEIYDFYMKSLNARLPTQHLNAKKKFVNTINSILPHNTFECITEFNELVKTGFFHNTGLNYLAYCIHKRKTWGLPTYILVIGTERIGKDTLSLDLAQIIYRLRNKEIQIPFLYHNMIWNTTQGLKAYEDLEDDILIGEEGYFLADRREFQQLIQIKWLQLQRVLAYKRNIVFTLMQDYTDIDYRIPKSTHILIEIYQRGDAKVFASSHSFPIIKIPPIDTTRFEKNPRLLLDKQRANYELNRLFTHMFDIKFKIYNDPAIWQEYEKIKNMEGKNALSDIYKKFEKEGLIEKKEIINPFNQIKEGLIETLKEQRSKT